MEKSYEEQIQEYNEILKSNPSDFETLRKLANTLASIGKKEEAIHEYEKYLRLNPNSTEILYLFGNFLAYIIKDKNEALKQYNIALKLEPNNCNLLYRFANILSYYGKRNEAIIYYEKSLQLEPNNLQILKPYLDILRRDKPKKALSEIEKILKNNSEKFDDFLPIYCKILLINYNKSLKDKVDAIFLKYSEHPSVLALYGQVLVEDNQMEYACDIFEKVLNLKPKSNIIIVYGHILMKLERYKEALEKFKTALEIKSKDITALNSYGHTLMKLERYEEALEKFKRVLKIRPKDITALRSYGHTLIKLERYDEALKKFEAILIIKNMDRDAYNSKIFLLKKLKKYEEVIQEKINSYKYGLSKNPNNIKILTAYGRLLAKIGEFEESFNQFDKLLKIDSNDIISLYHYGKVLVLGGEYQKAFKKFDEALAIKPIHVRLKDSEIYFTYAKALESNKQLDKAIEQMQKIKIYSIPIHLKNVYFLYLGKLYFITKEYDLAERAFKEIQSKSKSQKEALENIMQELISSEVKSKNILKNLGDFIEGFDKKDLDSISHIFSMEELFKFYADNELESKLQEDKELNSTIFHKLENHINLIRLTFDLIIKKNYSKESTKIAEELKERTTAIFKKIKAMREEQKKLNDEIGESLEEIEKKLNHIGEDIADKINNELSLLRVKIDLAQKKDLINEKTFSKLKKQIATSSAIADNLRIINKSTNLKIDNFQIRDIFENIEDKMTLQNATLSLDIRNEKNSFVGDKNRIKEIISELIENSIRHNSNKELKIDIMADDSKNPRINGIKHNGKYLYIRFNDNGIGIEEDKKEWVFLPTKTTSSEGSGLGLYIVRKAIKSMNGFIIENGTYEKGVQFEIFIPYK